MIIGMRDIEKWYFVYMINSGANELFFIITVTATAKGEETVNKFFTFHLLGRIH